MALICEKCIIGGVLQNGSMLSYLETAEAEVRDIHLEFQIVLDTDDEESAGTRDVTFNGEEIVEGTLFDGLVKGTLSGQWDVLREKDDGRIDAQLETFSRRGELAFLVVTAQDESGRTFFSASMRPTRLFLDPKASTEMRGTVFLGWDDPGRAG